MTIVDAEIYCNTLGAVILFQWTTNTLRLKWRQGFAGGATDCPLCEAEEETAPHFITECVVLEDVREQFGVYREDALEEILLFREKTEEKRNGSTNALTCTSVMWAHRGANKKA